MTVKQARATGAIVPKGPVKASCSQWDLKKFPTPKNQAGVIISAKKGVVGILGAKGMKTPQGIRIGSTLKQLKTAYPRITKIMDAEGVATYRVEKVPGNKKAFYDFTVSKGKVTDFLLGLNKQDCFN